MRKAKGKAGPLYWDGSYGCVQALVTPWADACAAPMGVRIRVLLLSCGWEHTKMDKKSADVRRLLIDFARLSTLQRNLFLETLNLFMYASPQRRRKIMLQWESGKTRMDAD